MKLKKLFIALPILLLAGCSNVISPVSEVSSTPAQPVARSVFPLPAAGNDVIGSDFTVTPKPGDTLSSIGTTYDIGYNEMTQANPGLVGKALNSSMSVNVPDAFVLPPAQYRKGIVINVAELRLFYFDTATNQVYTFPVALGREGWRTPITTSYVYRKQAAPVWNPPASVRQYMLEKHGKVFPAVVPAGPDNPLGDYAIYLQLNGYLIHGTNDPSSIGRMVSSGCIRMYNQDVSQLFPLVERGTPITIIYYPNKVGWSGNQLYLEAQNPIVDQEQFYQSYEVSVNQLIQDATVNHSATIDWTKVNEVVAKHRGMPVVIGTAN